MAFCLLCVISGQAAGIKFKTQKIRKLQLCIKIQDMVNSKTYPILKLICNHSSSQTHAHLNKNLKNREISNPRVFTEQCNTYIRLFSLVLAQNTAAMFFHTHCGSPQEPRACSAWPQAPQDNGVTIVFQLTAEAGHTCYHLVTALTFP